MRQPNEWTYIEASLAKTTSSQSCLRKSFPKKTEKWLHGRRLPSSMTATVSADYRHLRSRIRGDQARSASASTRAWAPTGATSASNTFAQTKSTSKLQGKLCKMEVFRGKLIRLCRKRGTSCESNICFNRNYPDLTLKLTNFIQTQRNQAIRVEILLQIC